MRCFELCLHGVLCYCILTHYELWWYGISGAVNGFVGPTGLSSSWTVLCCIPYCFSWQWTDCLCCGKKILSCWNCGTISPFEGECVRISSSCQFCNFCDFCDFHLFFCSQWFCYCIVLCICNVTVICDNEQAYDTQCLSQSHVLFLSRPVLFPVCF